MFILHNDKDDNIRNKSIYIYNKIKKQYSSSCSINPTKRKKYNLYFYDFGYDNWFNKRDTITTKNSININSNNLYNKKILSRNSTYSNFNLKYDNKPKNKINTGARGTKSDLGEISKYWIKNKNWNDNKRYYGEASLNKTNNLTENESMGFRELLNIVKKRSQDNKCKIDSNFSNLRAEIKKNNNGILQIRKIKKEKGIK